MDKGILIEKLKKIYSTLEEGLEGEWSGYEDTDEQPDARLTDTLLELEDLINELEDENMNQTYYFEDKKYGKRNKYGSNRLWSFIKSEW